MSWIPFVGSYALVTLAVGIALHRRGVLRLGSPGIGRTIAVVSLLLLLGELLAEERGLWTIPVHSGVLVLRTPLESLLLIATTAFSSLQIYAAVEYLLQRRGDRRPAGSADPP